MARSGIFKLSVEFGKGKKLLIKVIYPYKNHNLVYVNSYFYKMDRIRVTLSKSMNGKLMT